MLSGLLYISLVLYKAAGFLQRWGGVKTKGEEDLCKITQGAGICSQSTVPSGCTQKCDVTLVRVRMRQGDIDEQSEPRTQVSVSRKLQGMQ